MRPNPQVEKNKNWKAKFVKLEAKMVAMSVPATFGGDQPQVAPNFHVGGGVMLNNEEFIDFILSGMALTMVDLTLEALIHIWSQMTIPKEDPHNASLNLNL